MNNNAPSFENKIINNVDMLINLLKKDERIVFTNGCFDILHRGHVTYLSQARNLGDVLIVAVNSDMSVKRQNKGENRPINNLEDRMAVLASLESVSYVIAFDEDTPYDLIMALRPDILAKGGDWGVDKIVGAKEVFQYGGMVYSIPFVYNTSTTKTINSILGNSSVN